MKARIIKILNGYYQDCNASNPSKDYLDEEIAEISFKAGYEDGKQYAFGEMIRSHNMSKKEGIKEVVEWMQSNIRYRGAHILRIGIRNEEWQSKLKEWGVE